MSLAESASPSPSLGVHQLKITLQDDPPAQNLLSEWPALCKKYDIPCSAMFVSLSPYRFT